MRICSSGLKNDPWEPFSDSTPMISKAIPRIMISWPIMASRFELSSCGTADPSTATRRRADDAHVDVLVALLDLQVAAQLRHDRAHVLGVVGERRVVVQREAHAVAAGDAAHEALARIDAQ